MFSKSNLLSTLATGIFLFLGGYLVWGILTVDFFAEHAGSATGVSKEAIDLIYVAIGCLLEAFFMTAIYSKWANGVHSASEGFQFGALLGALFGFGEMFIWLGTSNLSDMTGFLVGGVINVIFMGVAGVVLALVYKATSK